jgi:hypothetical protein
MHSLALMLGLAFSNLAFSAPAHVHGEARLENRLSERLALDHGSDDLPGLTHADKPFSIIGILATTGRDCAGLTRNLREDRIAALNSNGCSWQLPKTQSSMRHTLNQSATTRPILKAT